MAVSFVSVILYSVMDIYGSRKTQRPSEKSEELNFKAVLHFEIR